MNLFNGAISITGITFQVFIIFGIIFLVYVIGRINCKGVSMGTSVI